MALTTDQWSECYESKCATKKLWKVTYLSNVSAYLMSKLTETYSNNEGSFSEFENYEFKKMKHIFCKTFLGNSL